MEYILLEDALNIMGSISSASQSLDKMRELRNLDTIDPIAIIDAEIAKCNVFVPQDDLSALVKLKSIFLNNH